MVRPLSTRVAAAAVVAVVLGGGTAQAARKDPNEREPPKCVAGAEVKFFGASPSTAKLGEPVRFSWDIRVPRGCTRRSVDLSLHWHCLLRKNVGPLRGSATLPVLGTGTYSLIGRKAGASRSLGRTRVEVKLDNPITIDRNDMGPTLTQALGTEGQTVHVRNNVDINLTGCVGTRVAQGVRLFGGRSPSEPGPRIRTGARPSGEANSPAFLNVVGDNVRIHGMRIEGPDKGVPDVKPLFDGIEIGSNTDVEIDNNEIYGWMGSGVEVRDQAGRIRHEEPYQVRVHDNYIHHNRHYGGDGYGVSVYDGAFPLIDRNVFDYNRHAIAGDGDKEAGYAAYDNVVLANGGEHIYLPHKNSPARFWIYTHQFDMHGESTCFPGHLNCGTAGHHMDIQHNAMFYARPLAAGIKLRGTPTDPRGMLVANNSFRLPRFPNPPDTAQAAAQTETGMDELDNDYGVGPTIRSCDYDGKGPPDSFMATGRSWWYALRGAPHWFYMARSTERPESCPPLQLTPVLRPVGPVTRR